MPDAFERWKATRIDLGHGHIAKPTQNMAGEHLGYVIDHPNAADPSKQCGGAVYLEGKSGPYGGRAEWKLESLDPLTLSPSVLCSVCGDHGFVRGGSWLPA